MIAGFNHFLLIHFQDPKAISLKSRARIIKCTVKLVTIIWQEEKEMISANKTLTGTVLLVNLSVQSIRLYLKILCDFGLDNGEYHTISGVTTSTSRSTR